MHLFFGAETQYCLQITIRKLNWLWCVPQQVHVQSDLEKNEQGGVKDQETNPQVNAVDLDQDYGLEALDQPEADEEGV